MSDEYELLLKIANALRIDVGMEKIIFEAKKENVKIIDHECHSCTCHKSKINRIEQSFPKFSYCILECLICKRHEHKTVSNDLL